MCVSIITQICQKLYHLVVRIYAEEEDLSSSLFIKDIRVEDSGYYSCKSGGVQSVVFLDVIGE